MQRARTALLALVGLGFVIQLVPYGRAHVNPEVSREPDWNDARTRELFFQACRDCHSNETAWPWYSSVAPMSWLVQRDVDEGRSHFNVSEWGPEQEHGGDAAEMAQSREMPPWFYLPAHPEARLTESELAELVAGLNATFSEERKNDPHDDHDHDH